MGHITINIMLHTFYKAQRERSLSLKIKPISISLIEFKKRIKPPSKFWSCFIDLSYQGYKLWHTLGKKRGKKKRNRVIFKFSNCKPSVMQKPRGSFRMKPYNAMGL